MTKNKIICIFLVLICSILLNYKLNHKKNISQENFSSSKQDFSVNRKTENNVIINKLLSTKKVTTNITEKKIVTELTLAELKKNFINYSIDELKNELNNIDLEIDNGDYIQKANANKLTSDQRKYFSFLLKKRDAIGLVKINKQLDNMKG